MRWFATLVTSDPSIDPKKPKLTSFFTPDYPTWISLAKLIFNAYSQLSNIDAISQS